MLERYDQSELLSLIEGDLDSRAAAALQARLADDPQVASMVESMIGDRAMLRSFAEPPLPHDFLVELEPMLSRPMLYEPVADAMHAASKPGEFRRQHLRRTRRTRWLRYAAAAALLLAAMGGGWGVLRAFDGVWSPSLNEMIAGNSIGDDTSSRPDSSDLHRSPNRSTPDSPNALTHVSREDLGPGIVHHNRPPRSRPSDARGALASASQEVTAASSAGEPMVVAAEFAIVLNSPSDLRAESAVVGAIADLGQRAALVKNFNYAEAQRLAREYRVAHGGSIPDGAPPAMAAISQRGSSTSHGTVAQRELHALAQTVREQLRSTGAAEDDIALTASTGAATSANATLFGDPQLAPTLEQQLEFSSRGATFTLAIPASEVAVFIERLALSDATVNGATTLRMLPPPANTDSVKDASRRGSSPNPATSASQATLEWLTEGPLVRQAMQRLAQTRDNTVVLVPVMIK